MYIKTIDFWRSVANVVEVFEYQMQSDNFDPDWYRREGEELREAATSLGFDPVVYVHAIAAFSPAVPWTKNKSEVYRMAKAISENPEYSLSSAEKYVGYGTNVQKTYNILVSGDTSYCRGEKVESFSRNLLGLDGVTIDRHAIHIAQFGLWANTTASASKRLAPGVYGQVAIVYELAMKIVNRKHKLHLTASQVQGVTWLYCAKER